MLKIPRSLALLIVAALIAVLLPAFAAPSTAQAATTLSAVRVVSGDRMLTLAWSSVRAANRYTVSYATNSKLKHAKSIKAAATTLAIKKLANKHTYYLRVVAYAGSRKLSQSGLLHATPAAGYPAVMPTVKVAGGDAPNQIRVSWTPLQRATRVIVLAGADNHQTTLPFHSAWLPATTTSTVLTIPTADRWLIGSGTANPIYVKVAQYNNLTATKILAARSDSAAYRISNSNFYGYATPLAPSGSTSLKVATYNVQSYTASLPGHSWADRREKVAANIAYSNADLVGLQEDNANLASNWQHRDLASLLGQSQYGSYLMAGDLPADYKANFNVYDSWFYYKPSKLTLLQVHTISPRDQLKVAWPNDLPDTVGAWAQFQINGTDKTFYALDIHLPASGSTDLKTRTAAALSTFITQQAGSTPAIFMGDLNSAPIRDGYCAPSKLVQLGWNDTASAPARANFRLQTVNSPVSYPTVPEMALNVNTGRIDYIMTQHMGGAVQYVNQVVMNADGTINTAYQGSDHNLQWAQLRL